MNHNSAQRHVLPAVKTRPSTLTQPIPGFGNPLLVNDNYSHPSATTTFPHGCSCHRPRAGQSRGTSNSGRKGHPIGRRSPRRRHPPVHRPHEMRSDATSGRPGSARSSPEPRAAGHVERVPRAWRGLRGARPGRKRARRYAERVMDGRRLERITLRPPMPQRGGERWPGARGRFRCSSPG